jgi:hypothetical protein
MCEDYITFENFFNTVTFFVTLLNFAKVHELCTPVTYTINTIAPDMLILTQFIGERPYCNLLTSSNFCYNSTKWNNVLCESLNIFWYLFALEMFFHTKAVTLKTEISLF